MRKLHNTLSTIFGAIVAIANAWVTIDWDNFVWSLNTAIKLFLSALIALGGYMTTINRKPLNKR
jgi:hypothetical protein